jgi:HEAT repeat protein
MVHVMAEIGTPKSLVRFTRALVENTDAVRLGIVKEVMADFENPALIVQFVANLQSSPSKNVQWASGYALANMGQSAATSELFDWAAHADTSKADWFEIAVATTHEFVQWMDSNLSTRPFNSVEIKQAVETVLVNVKGEK